MNPVLDLKVLKAISKRFNFEVDRKFKYITKQEPYYKDIFYNNIHWEIRYVDGCFYPYLFRKGVK